MQTTDLSPNAAAAAEPDARRRESSPPPPAVGSRLLPAPRKRGAGAMVLRFVLVLGALGLVVGLLAFLKARQVQGMIALAKSGAFVPPPVAVTTTTVQAAKWQPMLSAIGSLEAVQGVMISADLPGVVKEINFESGKAVKRGDVLVRLVTDQEQAQLEAAQAQRDLTVYSLRRSRELREKNANSQSDFDTAEANQRQAEANVSSAKAAVARKTISAPFDGELGIRQTSVGAYLNSGNAVVTLQSIDPIYVNFTLPQQNMRDFQVGSVVHVRTDATSTQDFEGKVTAVNPLVDSATRNFQVQATLANKEGKLRPGMFATVEVILGGERDVLPIPSSAIQYAPYGNSVFIVETVQPNKDVPVPNAPIDGKPYLGVRQQFIHAAQTKGDLVAITSGLKEGDQIVTSGVFKLQNAAAVQINNSVQPEANDHPKPEES